MKKILVQSRGVVGRNMASPGVRAYHIARVLAEQLPDARVTLSARNAPDIPSPHPRLSLVPYHNAAVGLLQMLRHDIIISRNFPPQGVFAFHKRLVLDFYTSFYTEWLAFSQRYEDEKMRTRFMAANRRFLDFQLTMADFILCSNERQRDLWVGSLSNTGLITPRTYDTDSTLRRLVAVVPYGVPPGDPQHARQVIKGVVPGIGESDRVLIWNGSIVEWFDAVTAVRAMAEVSEKRDDVKLFFLGTESPEFVASIKDRPAQAALKLSKELGLYERCVFFNQGWVPYDDLGTYLSEADISVCAGFDNLESRFAYRTRYVDAFWAGLPIVCTRGDDLADRIGRDPLGVTVDPGDASAFAAGILRLLDDREFYGRCKENLAAIKEELSWENVLAPVIEFCRNTDSVAVPKRQRLLPAIERMTTYLLARLLGPSSN